MMVGQEATQERQMRFAPFGDPFVIVAIGNRAADHQQQHLRQRVRHPPRLARVFDDGKMVEQRPKTRLVGKIERRGHSWRRLRIKATQPNQTFRKPETAVNPSSEP